MHKANTTLFLTFSFYHSHGSVGVVSLAASRKLEVANSIKEQAQAMELQNQVTIWQTQVTAYQQLAAQPGQDPQIAKMMTQRLLSVLDNPPAQAVTPSSSCKGTPGAGSSRDAATDDVVITSMDDGDTT